ncbi:MAG TPA: hypothetical protein VM165_20955, partial [Planctomycetaceae bacterium]|nr:hypothetical protein [Planctomycetaceae bacterium]
MPPVTLTLQPIVDELGLTVAAADQAYGILGGLAVTLTPLTVDPLALLFRFRIQVADEQLAAVRQVFQGLAGEKIEVLLATDEAQLAFVDLTGQTPAAIRTAVEEFAQALIALHVAAPGECVRCGTTDSVSAFYHQGQTSLVCPTCLQEA